MGGAEKALIALLKTIDPKRIYVDLLLFETGGILQKQVPSYVNVIAADSITRAMTLEFRKYFIDILKKGKIFAAASRLKMTILSKKGKDIFGWDIIKSYIPKLSEHYDVAIGFLEGFSDFFVIDKVNADKKIGWIHIDMTEKKPQKQEIEYYEQFDTIVTISERCKEAFLKVFPTTKNRIQILENIVASEEIIEKSREEVNFHWDIKKFQLVSVGRLDYQKGFDIGAKAARLLKEKGYNFCWHIYGVGIMEKEIACYIRENNLEDYYILEGLAENPYPYMKRAEIIVQPSRWEGKSIVLDEAKILGKAIIVTNYPSVTDQIVNMHTGLITARTPEAIAEGIEDLIRDEDLRKRLENNCRQEPNQGRKILEQFYRIIEA